jgi:putative protease
LTKSKQKHKNKIIAMNGQTCPSKPPSIMAPAGNKASFLAAVASGADEIYCGLKLFSARMEAKNFSITELSSLVELAHAKGLRVQVTLNALLKPDDLKQAAKLVKQLAFRVQPDGLIIQDLALMPLVEQNGFSGEIHLSTLTTVSFAKALKLIRQKFRIDGVVLPRELNVDEIKNLARACPPDLALEVFVHGALCYGVSGRCYWSSYLGGKSGLRGRCVQPCRRRYRQQGQNQRFFSCQDLSLDVLVKALLSIPEVKTWKIEGRKKGAHYVYYTVQGYRMLRDCIHDSQMKKNALQMLSRALGRPGTHYCFLPQRPRKPVGTGEHTGSGLFVGRIGGSRQRPFLVPREALIPGDVLRVGYEDEPGHALERLGRYVPKGGRFYFRPSSKQKFAGGSPVFLIDRRENELDEMISALENQLSRSSDARTRVGDVKLKLPSKAAAEEKAFELRVYRQTLRSDPPDRFGVWLSSAALREKIGKNRPTIWWWLPPVIWPDEEKEIDSWVDVAVGSGARNFVLNAPWQITFFKDRKGFNLWAGPFCNLTNVLAVETVKSLGFTGAIVSPELGREDYRQLVSRRPMPLGIVISGNWPLCVSRVVPEGLKPNVPFISPKGEQTWMVRYGQNCWVYPNWKLDLRTQKQALQEAGYTLFIDLIEPLPPTVKLKNRPGRWNWDISLV